MRKILCFSALFLLIAFALYADGDEKKSDSKKKKETQKNLSLGVGFSYANNPEFYGGNFEFGFDLYKNIFFIQNKFLFRAGGFKTGDLDNTALSLSDRLVFGRNNDDFFSMYAYIEGGAGFFGNAENNFSRDTLIYNFGFGGGIELGDFDFGGLYFEVGYMGQKMNSNYPLSGILFQAGWRIYL
jgi:hypothetical protein